jgi:hypothetical protein
MAGGGGWGFFRRYLTRLGVPQAWSWAVLIGAIVAALVAAIAGFHGVTLAAWCVGSVVLLAVAIPYAWGYLARRRRHSAS